MAGDGPIYTKVKQRIAQENINNVHVIGKILQEYLKSLYETADYFLLASNYEIYGMVVLEALYFGCPVLSTKTAGPTDMIIDGVNGYLLKIWM